VLAARQAGGVSIATGSTGSPLWVAAVLGGLCSVAGCGSAGSAAQAAAVEFYRAAAVGDRAAACALLAPQTRRELTQSERAPCEEALASVGLPAVGEAIDTQRFGHQAQVRFDADTAFLAEYDDGWRVVAAGCVRRDPLPYDCDLAGA
jgi:hypothetical protein